MKKMTSVLLALVMIFALAIPAFANQAPNPNQVDVAGESVAPTVTVSMPSGVTLGLNPYKMKYAGSTAFFKNEKGKQDQIISPIAVIENKSDVKLDVCAVVTATPSTGLSLVQDADAAATSNTNTAKTVYLTMQLGEAADKTGTGWKDANAAPTAAVFTAAGKVLYGMDGTTVIDTDDADGGKMTAVSIDATDGKTANYIGFKFGGAAAEAPATAWDSNDKIGVSIVFTFNPVVLTVAQNNG
jgi:hypothetical protein